MRITGHDSGVDHAGNSHNFRGVSQSARTAPAVNPGPARGNAQDLSALVRGFGLPADRLSASIVSAARYFSLPLEPGLLAKLRREVSAAVRETTAAAGEETEAGGETKAGGMTVPAREALSMAAAAAASRGAALRREALDEYAAAIDPGRRQPSGEKKEGEGRAGDPEAGNEKRGGAGTGGTAGGPGGGPGGGRKNGGGNGGPGGGHEKGSAAFPGAGRNSAAEPAALKERVLEAAERIPLLRFLNRIPGKDGRRWIVLPFGFTEGEKEYEISLRIMLEGDRCRMALDMAEGRQDGEILRRRLFVMERAPGKAPVLSVSLRPGRREAELRSLKKGLETCLGLPRDNIWIKNADNKMDFSGFFPQTFLLPSVNEEV
jgi:hypothetical protein